MPLAGQTWQKIHALRTTPVEHVIQNFLGHELSSQAARAGPSSSLQALAGRQKDGLGKQALAEIASTCELPSAEERNEAIKELRQQNEATQTAQSGNAETAGARTDLRSVS